MLMDPTMLAIAAAGLCPLCLYIIYSDVMTMRIPNTALLLMVAIFLPTGYLGLPTEIFLYRLLYTVIAFFVGYGIYEIVTRVGIPIGSGDLKMIIASVPWLPIEYFPLYAYLMIPSVIVSISAIMLVRWALRGKTEIEWIEDPEVRTRKLRVPAGTVLGLNMILFLGIILSGALERV
ncbi:MAG: A24 family peptidase [Pseudomonadota bacterium]